MIRHTWAAVAPGGEPKPTTIEERAALRDVALARLRARLLSGRFDAPADEPSQGVATLAALLLNEQPGLSPAAAIDATLDRVLGA